MPTDLRYVAPGDWREPEPPATCPNGHPLEGNCTVSWAPCSCTDGTPGHRTHCCLTCGATYYRPACTDRARRVLAG